MWSQCQGWAAEIAKLPPEPPGPAAIKGTALHYGILERKCQAEIDYRLKGTPVNVSYDDIPDWPEDGHLMADDFWHLLWTRVLEEILTGKHVYLEKKVMLFPNKDAGGTADVVVLYRNDKGETVLVVGDIKTGYHRVEPDEDQLQFYLGAAYLRAKDKGLEVDAFRSFIYQPTHTEHFTEAKFTKKQILSAIKRYEKAIMGAESGKPKYKAGEHCRFCQAQATCKAYNKHLSEKMDLEAPAATLPQVEVLSDETLLKLFCAADQIEGYLSEVRKHIIKRFTDNNPVPGLKVVAGVAKRKWIDRTIARDVLVQAGIDPVVEDIIGLGAAEKLLKAKGKKKEEIDAIMYTITEKPPCPPKVVLESDKRPAISLDNGGGLLVAMEDEVI